MICVSCDLCQIHMCSNGIMMCLTPGLSLNNRECDLCLPQTQLKHTHSKGQVQQMHWQL